jgi:hypothetical protein
MPKTLTVSIPDDPSAAERDARLERIEQKLDALIGKSADDSRILLNAKDASTRLGVSRRTVQSWADAGIVPFVIIDRRRWFRSADLEAVGRHEQAEVRT